MSKQSIPRRLDKEWRREYDKAYRARTKEYRRKQTKKYRSRPEVKIREKARVRNWYEEHKFEILSKQKQRDSTLQGKIRRWKAGAKRRGIEWSLTEDFIKSLPMICHWTGLPLTMKTGFPYTMSLDRVDSSKGYTPSNVVPCCAMVNSMKREFETEEFFNMVEKLIHHRDR